MQLENEGKVIVGSGTTALMRKRSDVKTGDGLLETGFRLARALGRALLFVLQTLALLGCAVLSVMTVTAVINGAFGPAAIPDNLKDILTATHLLLIFLTLPLSVLQLALPKGHRHHKIIGYAWGVLMLTSSVLSFGIHRVNGGFSSAHVFSVMALVFVPLVVFLARRKMHLLHRITVLFSILILQVGAGTTAFLTHRALGQMFWSLWQ